MRIALLSVLVMMLSGCEGYEEALDSESPPKTTASEDRDGNTVATAEFVWPQLDPDGAPVEIELAANLVRSVDEITPRNNHIRARLVAIQLALDERKPAHVRWLAVGLLSRWQVSEIREWEDIRRSTKIRDRVFPALTSESQRSRVIAAVLLQELLAGEWGISPEPPEVIGVFVEGLKSPDFLGVCEVSLKWERR